MLREKQIKLSNRELLTPANVAKAIDKGIPTAKKWLQKAAKENIIYSWRDNRGVNYCYRETQENDNQAENNIQKMPTIRQNLTIVGGNV